MGSTNEEQGDRRHGAITEPVQHITETDDARYKNTELMIIAGAQSTTRKDNASSTAMQVATVTQAFVVMECVTVAFAACTKRNDERLR